MSLTELNIFEIKIHLDTNIKELRNVIFEREMLYDPKKRSPKKIEPPPIPQTAPPPIPQTTPSITTQVGGYNEYDNNYQYQSPSMQNNRALDQDKVPVDLGMKTTIYTLNKYPFFTYDVEYPILILKKYNYDQKIEFFFKKDTFKNLLTQELLKQNKTPILETDITDKELEKKASNKKDIINKNILTMLSLLFPTKYPQNNNTGNSYDIVLNKYSNFMNVSGFFNSDFTYFKFPEIKNKIFTVSKTIWINDFLNHPEYKVLLNNYVENMNTAIYKKNQNIGLLTKYKNLEMNAENPNKKIEIKRKIETLENENRKLDLIIKSPFETIQKDLRSFDRYSKKSSNEDLQNLLEEKITSDELSKFFQYLYSFIVTKPYDITDDEKDKFAKLLDVGVTYILNKQQNTELFIKPKEIEIYVLVDLVEGKLTDEIIKNEDCKYMGEYLGNELEIYLNDWSVEAKQKILDRKIRTKWDIQRSRPMIVLGKEIPILKPVVSQPNMDGYQSNMNGYQQNTMPFENNSKYVLNDESKIQEAQKIYDWLKETDEGKTENNRDFLTKWENNVSIQYNNNPIEYISVNERQLYSLIKDVKEQIESKNNAILTISYGEINRFIDKFEDKLKENRSNIKEAEKYQRYINLCKIIKSTIQKNIKGGKSKRKTKKRNRKNVKCTRKVQLKK